MTHAIAWTSFLTRSRDQAARLDSCHVALAAALVGLMAVANAKGEVRMEAYLGEPFGIGRVTVTPQRGSTSDPSEDDRFAILSDDVPILYPVIGNQPVRKLVRQFLGIGSPWRTEFYFMFQSDQAFDATVYAPDARQIRITPDANAEGFHNLVDDWWDATTYRYQQAYRDANYPMMVENYLVANWARRLERRMPEAPMYLFRRQQRGGTWLSQLAASEAYKTSIERDIVLGNQAVNHNANQAPPEPPARPPLMLPIPPAEVEVESIATHVPIECFYLRFGNFSNYLWFRDFLRHWQGDLGNMLTQRSIDRQTNERLQQQLGIGETKLSRIMGPAVIRDVAIIGFDAYLRDGAAMGILFETNNSPLLQNNLATQRQQALENHEGGKQETLRIAGHEVSYVSSSNGHLRSYYAIDGDFHLVTTSRRLVERFFQAGQGQGALATSPDFLHTRSTMPLTRNDTVFLYASDAFLENLASPDYRIELERRVRSVGEMRILKLARLASRAEGIDAQSIDELIAAELLPPGFARRADGSKLLETDGGFRDSARGYPGWMVPVSDMSVESVTPSEAQRYQEFQHAIQHEVGQFVPLAVGMRRDVSDDGEIDRIIADLRLAPYSQTRLVAWADMLGPATTLRVAPVEGDVVSAQVAWNSLGEPVHIFGGLRDSQPPLAVRDGQPRPDGPIWQTIRAYVGTWPRPHLFDRFFGRSSAPVDQDGVARTDGWLPAWQHRLDDFFLFSFKRDVLLEVAPQLAMVEAPHAAQLRLDIADFSDKQIEAALSAYGYSRTRDTSTSATRFMNSIVTLLQVPPHDARDVAEQLVVGRFECPLGGEYELFEAGNGRDYWVSTATPPENRFLLTTIPASYQMPLVEWFRGLTLDLAQTDDAIQLRAELYMVHQETKAPEVIENGGLRLPRLGALFGGWGDSEDSGQEQLLTPINSEE